MIAVFRIDRQYIAFANDFRDCSHNDGLVRHLALKQALKNLLVLNEQAMFAATAVFQYNSDRGDGTPRMLAEWTVVPYDCSKDKRAKYEWATDDDDPNNSMNPNGG